MVRPRIVVACFLAAIGLTVGCAHHPRTIPAARLTQITTTAAVVLPGQNLPARADTSVIWLAADRTRRDNGRQSYVMRIDTERMLMIDRGARTYLDLSLDEAGRLMAGMAAAPDTASLPRDRLMHDMFRVAAKVTATEERSRIDGYDCRRYVVELHLGDTQLISEQWVTRDLELDDTQLRRASFATLLGLPGAADAMVELARIDGVPVRTTTITTLMNREIHSETRLAEVAKVLVEPDFFAAPAGYQPLAPDLPVPGAAP
jgi:hypothetical protein